MFSLLTGVTFSPAGVARARARRAKVLSLCFYFLLGGLFSLFSYFPSVWYFGRVVLMIIMTVLYVIEGRHYLDFYL